MSGVDYFILAMVIAIIAFDIFVFISRARMRKRFAWSYNGKIFVAEVHQARARLLCGDTVVDEFEGRGVKTCTLKTFVDGAEFSVRVEFGFRVRVEGFVNGKKLDKISA